MMKLVLKMLAAGAAAYLLMQVIGTIVLAILLLGAEVRQ